MDPVALEQLVDECARLPRESMRETRLTREIRKLGPESAITILEELIQHGSAAALPIAQRVLHQPADLSRVFNAALRSADGSKRTKPILVFGLKTMGIRRVMRLLREHRDSEKLMALVRYYLPGLVEASSREWVETRLESFTVRG